MKARYHRNRLFLLGWLVALLCLASIIGITHNAVASSQIRISDNSGCTYNPGPITITGQVRFENKWHVMEVADRFFVDLINQTTGNPIPYAYTTTDSMGYFSVTGENPGAALVTLRFWTSFEDSGYNPHKHVRVTDVPGATVIYKYLYEFSSALPDGTHNLPQTNLTIDNEPAVTKASRIKTYLQDSYDLATTLNMHRNFSAAWPCPYFGGNMYCMCDPPSLCEYDNIYLTEGAYDNPDVVIHEAGHAVMEAAYNSTMPYGCVEYLASGCPDHTLTSYEEPKCAWMEGWATFWSMKVRNSPFYQETNLEEPTWGTPIWWPNGDEIEGRVAGALWDINDSADDGWDDCDGKFTHIWNTLILQWHLK